jgi:hypothetical protein
VLNGHLNYYAVPGNKTSIDAFRSDNETVRAMNILLVDIKEGFELKNN